MRTKLSGEVFSPPFSNARVCGVERGLVVQALNAQVCRGCNKVSMNRQEFISSVEGVCS